MFSRLLLFAVLATSCGPGQFCQGVSTTTPPPPPQTCAVDQLGIRIHPKLLYAVELFSADAIRYSASCYQTVTIGMMDQLPPDVPEQVIGYCNPAIELRALLPFWERASATERLVLMYHELGHCALGLDHKDGAPDIMNSYMLDEVTAARMWDALVKTMFTRAKS